jgi:hypothetical protein
MKIISSFKDYYDFVANQYGGGDPRLVYTRQPIGEFRKGHFKNTYIEIDSCLLMDLSRWYRYKLPNEPEMHYAYLIVAGKAYLLAKPHLNQPPLYKNYLDGFKVQRVESTNKLLPKWITYHQDVLFEREYPFLVELCRKAKAPVFVIEEISWLENRRAEVCIHERCPILSRLGMPELIDPYQMYQELSMFVGNKIKDTPDTQPPVELSNKSKITKAGFDLVKSFRHRV